MTDEATRKAAYRWCADAITDCLGAAVIDGVRQQSSLSAEVLQEVQRIQSTLSGAGKVVPIEIEPPPTDAEGGKA